MFPTFQMQFGSIFHFVDSEMLCNLVRSALPTSVSAVSALSCMVKMKDEIFILYRHRCLSACSSLLLFVAV